jgi:glycosyltransferase involved in cell wall biosynthesis
MKLAYLTDHFLPRTSTDTEQFMAMANAFAEIGIDATIVLPKIPGKRIPEEKIRSWYGLTQPVKFSGVTGVFLGIRFVEKAVHGLRSAFHPEVKNADVVISRNLNMLLPVLWFAKTPFLYETYRHFPRRHPLLRLWLNFLQQSPRCLGVVCHSGVCARSFLNAGWEPDRILLAHNGVDLTRLKPERTRAEARAICGLPENVFIAAYSGRISAKKATGLLLEAAKRTPDVLWLLIGQEKNSDLDAKTCPENVRLLPWMPFQELSAWLYAANVLIIPPSRAPLEKVGNTVLPMKTFLYRAAGRAILAGKTPDIEEILVHEESALLVPPDDFTAFVSAVERLKNDAALCEKLATANKTAAESLSWNSRANLLRFFIEKRLKTVSVAG